MTKLALPKECMCDPDTWGDIKEPKPICAAHNPMFEGDCCLGCYHDKACHDQAALAYKTELVRPDNG